MKDRRGAHIKVGSGGWRLATALQEGIVHSPMGMNMNVCVWGGGLSSSGSPSGGCIPRPSCTLWPLPAQIEAFTLHIVYFVPVVQTKAHTLCGLHREQRAATSKSPKLHTDYRLLVFRRSVRAGQTTRR